MTNQNSLRFLPGDEVVDKYGEPAELIALGYNPEDPWTLQMYWVKLKSWTEPQWRDEGFLRTKSQAADWLKSQIKTAEEDLQRSIKNHAGRVETLSGYLSRNLSEFV